MTSIFESLRESLKKEESVVLCTVLSGTRQGRKMLVRPGSAPEGDLGSTVLNRLAAERALELLTRQLNRRLSLDVDGEPVDVFVEVYPPPPRLILVGAVHVAIPLITFARTLGFRTIVVDPRTAFATPERFSHADELRAEWPQEALSSSDFNESTCLAVLSHDEKLDNPALKMALENSCRYIGALGSRKTHSRRVRSLLEAGVTEEQLRRIRAPIGLDLGGRRPEEIAVAVIAEIVAVQNGVDPSSLSGSLEKES